MHPLEQRPSGPTPGGYEFKRAEEVVVGAAAAWIGYYAWIAIFLGVLFAGLGATRLPGGAAGVGLGIVYVLIGLYFRGAAVSMKSVVTTTGRDVQHLILALDSLTLAFKVQVVLSLAALAGGVVAALLLGGVTLTGG